MPQKTCDHTDDQHFASECPFCQTMNHFVRPAPSEFPNVGVTMLCVTCSAVSLFAEQGVLRAPTPEEMEGLEKAPVVINGQRQWRAHSQQWGVPTIKPGSA